MKNETNVLQSTLDSATKNYIINFSNEYKKHLKNESLASIVHNNQRKIAIINLSFEVLIAKNHISDIVEFDYYLEQCSLSKSDSECLIKIAEKLTELRESLYSECQQEYKIQEQLRKEKDKENLNLLIEKFKEKEDLRIAEEKSKQEAEDKLIQEKEELRIQALVEQRLVEIQRKVA